MKPLSEELWKFELGRKEGKWEKERSYHVLTGVQPVSFFSISLFSSHTFISINQHTHYLPVHAGLHHLLRGFHGTPFSNEFWIKNDIFRKLESWYIA